MCDLLNGLNLFRKPRNSVTKLVLFFQIKKISMSNTHTLFLTEEGNIYGCGKGSVGQLGPTMKGLVIEAGMVFESSEKETVLDIYAGEDFSVFITQRTVYLAGKFGLIGSETGAFQKFVMDDTLRAVSF